MDVRQQRGLEIAKNRIVKREGDGYLVPSESVNKKYYFVNENFECNCPDSEFHRTTCKHAYAVRYYLMMEQKTPIGTVTKEVRVSYKQEWSSYNQAQKSEVKLFDELLSDLVENVQEPPQEIGRPHMSLKKALFLHYTKNLFATIKQKSILAFQECRSKGADRQSTAF
jgi:hypothetical protein